MQKDALWSDPNEGVPISPVGYARRQRASQRAAQAFTHHAARGAPEAPSGSVSQRWQVDLGPDLQPRELLAGPRGVVACGMSGYQGSCRIVRWSGEVVGDVPREAPGVALDRRGAHLLTTHEGKPTVYSLLKGRGIGGLPVLDQLVEIQRFSSFYLFCTKLVPPWHSRMSMRAGAELLFLPTVSARRLSGTRPVIGAYRIGDIFSRDSEMIRGAAGPSGVVLATERGLQWTDWMLRPGKVVRMSTRPVAIAVGPDEDVVLVAEIDRRPHLLIFAPDGTERARVVLPDAKISGLFIGENNLAVVSGEGYVRAFDMDATVAWELSRQGKTAAVGLEDDALMYEHDLGLWVRERSGTTRRIWTAPAPLATSPVTHRHRWYVATADTLYALET